MNKIVRFNSIPTFPARQRGMVLLVSLVFLLLLTLLGISSMQNATLQERWRAVSWFVMFRFRQPRHSCVWASPRSWRPCFQWLLYGCLRPAVGFNDRSQAGVGHFRSDWIGTANALFGIQNLGTTPTPIKRPANCTGSVTMYRVTAIAIQGTSRTVLESIYANC